MLKPNDNHCVTVYCLTYNHERYIEKCLDSLVAQKTSFKFKIIVHDDASTDKTTELVKVYYKKYPDKIIPVIQENNQHSKGINVYDEYIKPLITSEFVAICEGDDFWASNDKLQMQYDYMMANPDCSLCVHNTQRVNEDGTLRNEFFNHSSSDMDYNAHDVIEARGGERHR